MASPSQSHFLLGLTTAWLLSSFTTQRQKYKENRNEQERNCFLFVKNGDPAKTSKLKELAAGQRLSLKRF